MLTPVCAAGDILSKIKTFALRSLTLAAIGLLLVAPASVRAEVGDVEARISQDLVQLWGQRASAMASGDDRRVELANAAYVRAMRDSGVNQIESASFALIEEIDAALEREEVREASARLDLLAEISGSLPEGYWARSRVQRAENLFGAHRWALSWWRGVWARVTSPDRASLDALLLVKAALLFCSLIAGVFIVAQTARYGLHIILGAANVLPGAYGWGSSLVTFVCLLGGTLYFLGPISGLCLWCGLLVIYQSPGERIGIACLMGAVLLAPYSFRLVDQGVERAVHEVSGLYKKTHNVAARYELGRHDEALAQIVDGISYKRIGEYTRAKMTLERAVGLVDGNRALEASLHNTLGATYFGLKEWAKARTHFDKAMQLAPGSAAPVFNLHRVHAELGDKEESEAMARVASRLEPRAVVRWQAEEGGQLNRVIIDLEPSRAAFVVLMAERAWVALKEPSSIWTKLVGARVVPAVSVSAGLCLIFMFVVGRLRSRLRIEWPCDRCALPVPVRLVDIDLTSPVCEQCTNIFLRTVPVDRRVRYAKETMVTRWATARRWLTRTVSFVAPGISQLVRGDFGSGVRLASVGCLAATVWVLPGDWAFVGGFGQASAAWGWTAVVVYVIALSLGIRGAFRETGEGGAWS